ncbi:hypothetical protein NDU88_003872 [Pleurodeles waltl]|uniref:Uncharacterized protein n=1 Tax=Pleurodeles waltl TaxID=8319 RepID=A0AAV7SH95_PLEWA|nr:hypothetical protein NDU88_003872 [Pleurodeles waltl]
MAPPQPITQNCVNHFHQEIRTEITSSKDDLKDYNQEVLKEVSGVGERVDDLEHTVDKQAEDQEMFWRHMVTLEEQHNELQLKKEDLETRSHQHNV